ncbi:hypothetical protein [Sphingomonas sp. PB4P5]|uniref:hypothetical protein n=1 Tax=Parasphingomonas puruogangriensis TaxID=3096155 RepID=UPI002FC60F3F
MNAPLTTLRLGKNVRLALSIRVRSIAATRTNRDSGGRAIGITSVAMLAQSGNRSVVGFGQGPPPKS